RSRPRPSLAASRSSWCFPFVCGASAFEVVQINPSDVQCGHVCDTDAEIDHVVCKLLSIDQNDALVDPINIFHCVGGEAGRRDEHPLPGSFALKAAGEALNDWATDRLFPAFGLYVDKIEAKPILLDDAVDAAVSALAD